MNLNPGHVGPGGGTFRAPPPGAASPSDAAPTERITGFRPRRPQRAATPPAAEQPSRGRRTRRTVDLPAATHRALDIWQREAADRLGVARVTGQEVISALIDQLLADPQLTAQITRAIQERR
ncbi:ATPase [Mycobacterium sp. HUMS_1102779]|uniref:ATPase n=1 Tax=Mycobacterium sp. HUMS_1102779 TaxID=3383487 RepID=UPI003899E793